MIITPSFFETFYQGYYPGRNAGPQSGDICPGGRPEALSHVFERVPEHGKCGIRAPLDVLKDIPYPFTRPFLRIVYTNYESTSIAMNAATPMPGMILIMITAC